MLENINKKTLCGSRVFLHGTIHLMHTSTPEADFGNWYRFTETDSTPEWEIEDPDSCEEDSYDEDSNPDTE